MKAAKRHYLDFEKPIAEIEEKVEELSHLAQKSGAASMADAIARLKKKATRGLQDLYGNLDAWQKTQVARHPERPHFADFVSALTTDYVELSGDRKFGEDAALLGGLCRFRGRPAMIIGHEKGRTTAERVEHNFGLARPEGYRKAVRLMDMADRYKLPVITLVDTAGAFPGAGAEERGQGEAIARSTERCLTLGVPMVSCIVGEGGSGGALAIAAGNSILMFEHAIYSVISPEGAASILWRDSARARDAAEAMKITAEHLKNFGVIDEVVPEPLGGAHRNAPAAIASLGDAIEKQLDALSKLSADELKLHRRERFYAIGRTLEVQSAKALAPVAG
ncbi:MAG: acetyl-CoA carboxylase carboxyltransferase subunit alpha [Caulobacterales bacterium]